MQAINFWDKFHIHRTKIILVGLLLVAGSLHAQSFKWARRNNPSYDDRKLTYGFLIELHTTIYQIKYSDSIVSSSLDTLHSVVPEWKPGFSLGFIVNYKIMEYLDLRLTPKVAFYEHKLRYYDIYGDMEEQLVETTMVEFPLLLKYKSARRGNIRAYMIGGISPGIEASGKKEEENVSNRLEVKNINLSLEGGIGFDLYFPLFKFSPEIRYSRGILNVLDNTENIYGRPMKYINTNTISVYLLFQ